MEYINKLFYEIGCNQRQTAELKNIKDQRGSKEFQFIYTKDAQMYAIPHKIFTTETEKKHFYRLLA